MEKKDCPHAKGEMTPCYYTDGEVVATEIHGKECCVGCEIPFETLDRERPEVNSASTAAGSVNVSVVKVPVDFFGLVKAVIGQEKNEEVRVTSSVITGGTPPYYLAHLILDGHEYVMTIVPTKL